MSETAVAKALSSDVTWRILELLVVCELEESEIARSLDIQPRVVKSSLQKLLQAGLVSAREETLTSGKVTTSYFLTRTERSVGFPPRSYEYLSEALVRGLVASLGKDGASMLLSDLGLRMGEDFGRALNSRINPSEWDVNAYVEHYVKRFLSEMRTYPRLVSAGRNRVVYEQLNCPFQELADKFPGIVCDVLDQGVHEGIDKSLGVKTTRLACKGHGDPRCRFSVVWPKRRGLRRE